MPTFAVVGTSFLQPKGGTTTGGPFLPLADAGKHNLNISDVTTQPTTDYIFNQIASTTVYTANQTGGDSLGLVSYMFVQANGHAVPLSGHTSAIYGNASVFDNVPGSVVQQVNGIMAVSGIATPGTLVNGVDYFGHGNYKSGGGTITNHYFLYQEGSSQATNEYGAFLSAPVGIGTPAPTYNLEISSGVGGNMHPDRGLAVGFGGSDGSFLVTSTGTYIYPAYNLGIAGGFGCTDLVVGYNGQPNPTTANTHFLFISACAGPPTAAPFQASAGRVAMTFDTVNHKLWMHDGTVWRGVVLT
jgi:hypothetical protein